MMRIARRSAIIAAVISLLAWAPDALAQSAGDRVRISTDAGVVEGTLIDRLQDGYLVRVGTASRVIAYDSVRSIETLDSASPPPARPAPYAQPRVVVVPAPPSYARREEAPRYEFASPALVKTGRAFVTLGVISAVTGAVLTPVGYVVKANEQCHDPSGSLHFDCSYGTAGSGLTTAGIVTLIVGGSFIVGGAIMIYTGASSRTVSSAIPTVLVGPRAGALQWTF